MIKAGGAGPASEAANLGLQSTTQCYAAWHGVTVMPCLIFGTRMLSLLIYSSRLVSLDDRGIRGLLTQARDRNARDDVTGALLFDQNHFLQCLEGSRQALTSLFIRIAADPRHTDVQLICMSDVDERIFPNWTMHYVGDTEPIRPLLRRFLPTHQFEPQSLSDRGASLLIRSLVDLRDTAPIAVDDDSF